MKKYKVKLHMSEEFTISAESEDAAIKEAKEKFGCDYYVDKVEVIEITTQNLSNTEPEMRKILFTNGMSNDYMLIITDAPISAIRKWCYRYNNAIENGEKYELFDTLKTQYFVKELVDSEVDEDAKELVELIGYDEAYDLSEFIKDKYPVSLHKCRNCSMCSLVTQTPIGAPLAEEEQYYQCLAMAEESCEE